MNRAFSPLKTLCKTFVVAPLFAVLVAGCGGGGTKPNPSTSGPSIVDNSLSRDDFRDTQDDRYYDIFICDVSRSGVASIEMRSLEVDALVLVYRKDAGGDFDLIGENDDISAANGDARLDFDVERGKSYRIIATSANEDERGDYSLFFSENLGRPARVLPDANRVAQSLGAPGVTLPPKPVKKAKP